MIELVQNVGNGGLVGLVYALLGLSIVVLYRASEAFNFAIGQFLVLGSFIFYGFFAGLNLPFLVAFPMGLLTAGLTGACVERFTIKPLFGRDPILTTKLTLGLYLFLSASVQFILSYTGSPGWRPIGLPDITIETADLLFLSDPTWAGFLSLGTFGLIVLFLFRTRWGLAIRATSENQIKATAFGIDARFVLLLVWAISAASISVAGIMISNFGVLSTSSASVGFRALPVVLIGGMDSLGGAMVGGMVVGICESLAGAYVEPLGLIGFKEVVAYILVLVVLFIRPHGLFGTPRIERV